MSGTSPSGDPWQDAAALIAEAGRSAEDAWRYRQLASTIAEPIFERALAIGSEVRRAAREGRTAALEDLTAELRELVTRCRNGIAEVRASSSYREAVHAFTNGDQARIAELAGAIFHGVVPLPTPGRLYWSVAIGGRGSVDHFLPAGVCAARIETTKREGLTTSAEAPERGGDGLIRPVLLSRRHDESESPIALAFDPAELPGPVCGLSGSELVLVYAERLTADFVVSSRPRPATNGGACARTPTARISTTYA